MTIPPHLHAWADDASALESGDVLRTIATTPDSLAIGTLLVNDIDLPLLKDFRSTLACVVTGGAGQILGPAGVAERHQLLMQRMEVTVRDLADPVGAVNRLIQVIRAGHDDGDLAEEIDMRIGMPPGPPDAAWLAAADEVAALGHPATLTAGPGIVEAIDAMLDRETVFGIRHTEAVGASETDGALRLLVATQRLWDGKTPDLDERFDVDEDLTAGRRWFDNFWATDPLRAIDELSSLAP